ncbi:uroporphyrinogen-III synthase [Silvibacterium acidisoli]|uniref:uroporphyrinogen-III synthase n=1 Tax=Acidobacteriaceae bacterium ZG23-2 TaxID=2883246 RepID=UPI00406C0C5B
MSALPPLAGKRILITRARHQAGQFARLLQEQGAETIEIPAIEIVPPPSFDRLDTALRTLAVYRWIVVTSANGARAIGDRLQVLGLQPSLFVQQKVAAIGSGTADSLRQQGIPVALTPGGYVAESLLEALGQPEPGDRILIIRAEVARDILPTQLIARGAAVDVAEAYSNVVPDESAREIATLFAAEPSVDAATFTSSSTVSNFFHLLDAAEIMRPAGLKAISIGPVTSRTLREHGWEPAAEADPHHLDGLVAATISALKG